MEYGTFRQYFFATSALFFVIAGLHHLYEFFVPELRPEYPPLRHIIFVVLNLGLAFMMIKRTKYFVPILLLISLRQLYGHGGSLLSSLYNGSNVLYTDVVIVFFVPLILSAYIYDVCSGR